MKVVQLIVVFAALVGKLFVLTHLLAMSGYWHCIH